MDAQTPKNIPQWNIQQPWEAAMGKIRREPHCLIRHRFASTIYTPHTQIHSLLFICGRFAAGVGINSALENFSNQSSAGKRISLKSIWKGLPLNCIHTYRKEAICTLTRVHLLAPGSAEITSINKAARTSHQGFVLDFGPQFIYWIGGRGSLAHLFHDKWDDLWWKFASIFFFLARGEIAASQRMDQFPDNSQIPISLALASNCIAAALKYYVFLNLGPPLWRTRPRETLKASANENLTRASPAEKMHYWAFKMKILEKKIVLTWL